LTKRDGDGKYELRERDMDYGLRNRDARKDGLRERETERQRKRIEK
jgi:hypothetical protein